MNTKSKMIPMDLSVTFPLGKDRQSLIDLKQLLFSENLGNPDQILSSILSTDVGQEANRLLQFSSIPQVLVLEDDNVFHEFMKRHKSMNYSHLFNQKESASSFFKRRKRSKGQTVYRESKPLVKNQAHPAFIRESCATVMHRVITPTIFGNNRNKKKILKNLFRLMQTAKTESFSLLPLVEQINIESITWLTIEDQKLKLILVAKLLKWMFRFFLLLICKYFSIMYVKEERVFCFIRDLNKEIKKDLATKNKKGILEKCPEVDVNSVQSRMYMVPKDDGFRTITRRKYTAAELQSQKKVLGVLTFLFDRYLKIPGSSFENSYVDVTDRANYSSEKYYITTTDIRDAFGSIIQNKLFDILTSLFELMPEILEFTEFKKRGGSRKYVYGFPRFEKDRFGNNKSGRKVIALKSHVIEILEETIFNTKVKIHNKVYNMCKGVAQGSILSSRLSDIYYVSMQQKYFADFRKSGQIFSHVDDIIYFTINEESAKQFLNRIEKGIPEYNCWFKKSKIVSNFDKDPAVAGMSSKKTINFLGWSINSMTLELEPYLKHSMRYSMLYSATVDLQKLKRKLTNIESIRLKQLVLDKSINNNDTILSNIKTIANLQAKRCFAIANSINVRNDITLDIIAKTNFILIRRIERATNWTNTEKLKYKKEIRHIFWKAYYATFVRRSDCFPYLTKKFKKLMKKNSQQHKKPKNYKAENGPLYLVSKRARRV